MKPARVVDAHVHSWDPSVLEYPWVDDVPLLRRAFLPMEFAPLSSGASDAVVFVEANCDVSASEREVEWVEMLAEQEPRIAGIVAYADLLTADDRPGALGLTFDLCATADQLHDVTALVRQCPSTEFMLDHCGKPDIRHNLFVAWSRDLALRFYGIAHLHETHA